MIQIAAQRAQASMLGLSRPSARFASRNFSPVNAGAVVFYDTSKLNTYFQDAEGLIPATRIGDPIGRLKDSGANGDHAVQPSAMSRPVLGQYFRGARRNVLNYTENLENEAWSLSAGSASGSVVVFGGTSNNTISQAYEIATDGVQAVFRVGLQSIAGRASYRVNVQERDSGDGFLASSSFDVDAPSGISWIELARTGNQAGGAQFTVSITRRNENASDGDALRIIEPQFEIGTLTATRYQRIAAPWNMTEEGVPSVYAPYFDGVDDYLQLPTIDLSGTDAITVALTGRKDRTDAAERAFSHKHTTGGRIELYVNPSSQLSAVAGGTVDRFSTLGSTDARQAYWQILRADISGSALEHETSQLETSLGGLGSGNFSSSAPVIGARQDLNATFFYRGFIGSVALFDSRLADSQMPAFASQLALAGNVG